MSSTEYRCATYDAGGMRIADELRPAEGLTAQELADKIGAEAGEITRPPFPRTVLVWNDPVETSEWLHKMPPADADAVAGRWHRDY